MLDIKFIRENREVVEAAIKNKKVKDEINLDELIELHDKKSELRTKLDELNAQRNEAAKAQNIEEGKRLKEEAAKLEDEFNAIEKDFINIMLKIPNIPSPDTPVAEDESGNVVLRQVGEKPQFNFEPKAHWDLGPALDIIDNEKAAEVSGARFTYIKGDLALLQFAIIQFALSVVTNEDVLKTIAEEIGVDVDIKSFIPVIPPAMLKPAVLNRMARLEPREDKYYIEDEDVFLAGSAEHTLGPIHMDETLAEADLPKRYIGYGTAFRKEAGTYGKDTKGILRQHQFDKLEMQTFSLPEKSKDEQDFIVGIQEYVMKKLQLPYQVVQICTGDMAMPDYRQVDIETWMPGQDTYRETHTSDLNTSFQSRRLNTKVKRADGKSEFVHMNDATLFAMGRILIAIIENYQNEDGTIQIPLVLQPYMGGRHIIGAPANSNPNSEAE